MAIPDPTEPSPFLEQAERKRTGFLADFVAFLRHYKLWWLLPVLILLLCVGAFLVIGGSAATPWVYALF